MSLNRVENTSLWKKSLALQKDDIHSLKREELRSAFFSFRSKIEYLVSHIAKSLPNLTQHEISHLDALWETASLIAGDDYPLNALEGFVLGSAILLHDSALCFEAYENGINGVRNTIIWKDAYAATADENTFQSEDARKSSADFAALRHLHAQQSANLIEKNWIDPDTGDTLYLIENSSLRKHLGQLIGKISASHHWSIEEVSTVFSSQVNALASFPRDWRVDPIKIACLLRCADAAHIDNERAPDFLHALIHRQGISFRHWQAQNRLASVDIDYSDSKVKSLIFTSTRSFTENESDSWWVAFDATCLVDKEIKSSNALLESLRNSNTPPFEVKNVKGVESPELMMKYIKVEGWSPCSAELHVGNVEKLVRNLGGKQLYGDDDTFQISLRELIQNARDSIQARLIIDPDFQGKITVKIFHDSQKQWLLVEDNGVGMSHRVLTGPLLDFGTSFWTSSLVQSEFPGLRASKFRSIGRFGIGFYSVFMVADQVYVTSRPWNQGINDAKQIQFKNGLTLRPLLRNGPFENFSFAISTQIKMQLKDGLLDRGLVREVRRNSMNSPNLTVDFVDYLSAVCAGLDVTVFFSDDQNKQTLVHKSILDDEFDKQRWLEDISFSKYQDESISQYIKDNSSRMRFIEEDGNILGLAAISTLQRNEQNFLSMRTIGGLASSVHMRDGSLFIGFIDTQVKSARRESSLDYAPSEKTLQAWAKEQFELINELPLNPVEKYFAGSSLAQFGVDPVPIVNIFININGQTHFKTLPELAKISESVGIAIIKSNHGDYVETHHNIIQHKGYVLVIPFDTSKFMHLKFEGGIPLEPFSFIACLYQQIMKNGKNPILKTEKSLERNSFGEIMDIFIVSAE